jgi:CRISPR-associated protein Csb3
VSDPIRVAVDPANPGQFFACCGLLELADRLWPQTDKRPAAEGWFEGREFFITSGGDLSELLQRLSAATVSSSLTDAQLKRLDTLQSMDKRKRTSEIAAEMDDLRTRWRLERLHLSEPFDLWMDWWHDNSGERTDLKTWAAKVKVLGMVRAFHGLIKATLTECLTQSARADVLPFYFDSDAGAQGSAQDAGFSAYDLRTVMKGHSPTRPLIELGSFIAFQRFRPRPVEGTDLYRFSTWTTPFPVSVAGAVAVAAVEVPGTQLYEFRLFSRTQYMKTFLPATPLGGSR